MWAGDPALVDSRRRLASSGLSCLVGDLGGEAVDLQLRVGALQGRGPHLLGIGVGLKAGGERFPSLLVDFAERGEQRLRLLVPYPVEVVAAHSLHSALVGADRAA